MGFFSNNNHELSSFEIDSALKKLTDLYDKYSREYGAHIFNYSDFRKRYLEVLKNKTSIALFFKIELEYLEKQKQMVKDYQAKKEEISGEQGFLEKTLKDIIEKTSKYPEEPLNDRANVEIKRIIGACRFIAPELEVIKIYVPIEKSTLFHQNTRIIQDIVDNSPQGFNYQAYLSALNNSFLPITQLDSLGQKLLKEIGIALQTIVGILQVTDPVHTGHITEYLSKLITDFRLEIFKGLS